MKKSRIAIVFLLLFSVCAVFVLRLAQLQLIDGADYLEQSMNRAVSRSSIPAARGEILDRYCRPLVTNTLSLTVEINLLTCKDLNGTIAALQQLFTEYGGSWQDTFPISRTEPYLYTTTSLTFFFRSFVSARKGDPDQTADAVLASLADYYGLSDLPLSAARDVLAVRYEIERVNSGMYYTFAEDVPLPLISAVRERSFQLSGVSVLASSTRSYTETWFAAHVLGYMGKIDAGEVAEYVEEKHYSMSDSIGKVGIERYCESYLRGTPGTRYTEMDVTGAVTDTLRDDPALAGNDVILTLDKDLQNVTEDVLAEIIAQLREVNGEEAAKSGAALFMDIPSGEILSMVSWPDYNPGTFYEDYSFLSQEEAGRPYLNRTIAGSFPPGSTYKIVTAIAGLEEGIITENTTFRCTGRYTYYSTYQPTCNDALAHGTVNVKQALQKSCNCFFYDVGRQLGSDKLAEYAKRLGFGSLTGIDLNGEISGTVASRSQREAQGRSWNQGEDLLAAIGQADNAVTPIQLLSAVATVANGGIRIQPHVIKSILNRETGEAVVEKRPTVLSDTGISQKTLNIVRTGMEMVVGRGGTAYNGFSDFTMTTVAVKTGTSEMPHGPATALMVGYAPADDPKIAFAVVIENGGLGVTPYNAQIVKTVLSYYFSNIDAFDRISAPGGLVP